mmetsp:Transcript_68797/g.124009  ORF Transcript_68797/g.124009 Transcript_68797/m.124009 type:complete len:239 (+) Transcript_68797:409-1125(+)
MSDRLLLRQRRLRRRRLRGRGSPEAPHVRQGCHRENSNRISMTPDAHHVAGVDRVQCAGIPLIVVLHLYSVTGTKICSDRASCVEHLQRLACRPGCNQNALGGSSIRQQNRRLWLKMRRRCEFSGHQVPTAQEVKYGLRVYHTTGSRRCKQVTQGLLVLDRRGKQKLTTGCRSERPLHHSMKKHCATTNRHLESDIHDVRVFQIRMLGQPGEQSTKLFCTLLLNDVCQWWQDGSSQAV